MALDRGQSSSGGLSRSGKGDDPRLKTFVKIAGGVVFVTGLLVLFGWAFNITALKRVLPYLVTMKANTALCFVLCGAALYLSCDEEAVARFRTRRRVVQIVAAAVCLAGLATLAEYVFGLDLGIDTFLFVTAARADEIHNPGRMSPATAFNFVLIGVALLSLTRGGRKGASLPSQWLALAIALVALVIIVGYAYNVEALYRVYPVALHTAVLSFIAALGLLFARGFRGLTAIFSANSAGGLLARRLTPTALIVPFVLGWLRLKGEQLGYYGTEFGLALFATSNIVVFMFLIWRTAILLDRLDVERKLAETNSRRLASIVESSEDAIISKTFDGTITSWNSGAETLFGYTAREAIGQNIRMLFPPELLVEEETILEKVRRGEPINHYETMRLRKDGSPVWVSLTISPVRDADGAIVAVSKIARDITGRRNAEQRLKESSDNFEALVRATTLAVWTAGEVGESDGIAHWWEELTGQNLAELGEWEWLESLHPDDREPARAAWSYALAHKTLFDVEYRVRNRRGNYQHFAVRGVPVFNGDGSFRQWMGTFTDITERKNAEEHLRESENRIRMFVEYAPASVAMFDREMKYLAVSRRWIQDYGLKGNLIGHSHYEIFPELPERWKQIHQRCLAGEVEKSDEERFERADGSVNWIKWEVRPWLDATGAVGGIIVFSEDITERKHAEDALRLEKERLEKTATASPSVIFSFRRSPEGKVSLPYSSPAVREIYGYEPEDLWEDCSQIFARVRPDELESLQAAINESAVGMSIFYQTIRYQHPLRGEIWLEISSAPTLEPDGSIIWHGVTGDVTERKQHEEEVLQLNESLEQKVTERTAELNAANRELEAFSYSVSHDLRAPLRSVDGFSLALLEDYTDKLDAEGQDYLRRVRAASQHMARLIDDMLNLARVTRSELKREDVDLSALAGEIVSRLRERQPGRDVAVRIEEDVWARGDERLLRIALENLLGNAWKFTSKREHAEIAFGLTRDNGHSAYFVRDNGAGFDMAHAGKLFGPFQRLHGKTEFEGTGIGLATVQRVVRRHGGEIRAEAEISKGATFYFTL